MTVRSIALAATLLALSATAAWPDVLSPERPLRHWKTAAAAQARVTTTADACTKAGGAVKTNMTTHQQTCSMPGAMKSSLDQAFIRR